MAGEKSKSRKGCLDMETRRDRDRGKERKNERGVEKERSSKRRCERRRSEDDEERKECRRIDSEEERRDKRIAKEKGRGSHGSKDRKRERGTERSRESDDDMKRRKESVGRSSRHEDGKKVDEEVEKRRKRVQEWKELQRKKEEAESQSKLVPKAWTLEGKSDDEENPDTEMDVDEETKPQIAEDEEEIDPLDAFMNSMMVPEVEKLSNTASLTVTSDSSLDSEKSGNQPKKGFHKGLGRIIQGEDSDSDCSDGDPSLDEDDEEFMKRVKKTKAEKLTAVDHSKVEYEAFRKNFYIEVKDISTMTQEQVNAYRKELEVVVRGKDVPRPVKSWHQTGLTNKLLDTIEKLNFEKPMPVQAQALPIIMSGRDCIGVATTGSGKTLGFVLPMLRHIKDQPPVKAGDGPIGLVMAPTRELVQQIHRDIRKFAKALWIRCVAVYGGSGIAQQISAPKRGTEIVVCTPGRMIDILCTNSGKITNLRRVTFMVMDEADRMFDMGFEPQITRIIQNIRPDRQTVLFSATFPRNVETLARKVLNKPVEIQVGGRSVVNKDITQLVEIRAESEKFSRLQELLREWYEKGKILVFVNSQEKCQALFHDITKEFNCACLSLHGGMDQSVRESTITCFKGNICNLLIATSVAARGLDVKELELVVNFDAPNHYEEYVHRVGRTGRAGQKGCALTFISEDEAKHAPDLVKALELSEQPVPDDLKATADSFMDKVKQGLEKAHGTGYGGSGFKFNKEEEDVTKAAKKALAKDYGFEEDESDSGDENDVARKAGGDTSGQQQTSTPQITTSAPARASAPVPNGVPVTVPGLASVEAIIAKIQASVMPELYEADLEINDFPQNARWKVTQRETLGRISDWSGAAITTRGQFYAPGRVPGPREQRKLYLFIEGPTEVSVKTAKTELKRVLQDITNQASSLPSRPQPGRYSVLS